MTFSWIVAYPSELATSSDSFCIARLAGALHELVLFMSTGEALHESSDHYANSFTL